MKAFWRYVQFWSVVAFAAGVLCLVVVWFEHSLYGCFIFSVGLGHYFFHGTVRLVERAAG